MENTLFTAETIYDAALHNEFRSGYKHASLLRTILGILLIPMFTLYIFLFDLGDHLIYAYLFWGLVIGLIRIPQLFTAKRGGPQYKRMVYANGGKPVHSVYVFEEAGILTRNRDNGNENRYGYDQIRSIIETKNLLILTMEYRLCLIVEKRWLRGGSAEELKAFLLERCPNCKRKVRRDKAGRIVNILLTIVLIVGSLLGAAKLLNTSSEGQLFSTPASVEQILEDLEPLGITCQDTTLSESLDEFDYGSRSEKILTMLCLLGYGEYDYETWEWTPSRNGVYWFDAEFLTVNTMYTDFLRGIEALNPEEIRITDIHEDHSRVNWELGTGSVAVSFRLNDAECSFEAEMMTDWFDASVLSQVCEMVREQCGDKELHYAYDGGQGYLVFFGDAQWAMDFERITGIQLTDSHFFFG